MPMILDSPPPELQPQTSDPLEERRRLHHEADIVIVGAGVLGCAAAITFARQGRSVILLEKSLKEPDRIVGELLQPGGVSALEKLGLRDCLEEIDAVRVQGYQVIYYGQPVSIPYPENAVTDRSTKTGKSARPEGRSFHHGRFIRRLRETAMKEKNITVVETAATEMVRCGYTGQVLGVECQTNGKPDYYFAPLTIVCDGYASKFRKSFHTSAPTSKSKFYALELHDADLPAPMHGHVLLGSGAPVLLYQIGTHDTRALIDVPENTPTASVASGGVKSHLLNQVLPTLPEQVKPSFAKALEEGKLRSMPNSFLPSATNTHPGMLLLGDAMNMRHPLTGGGMTVALNDVVLLSSLLSPEVIPSLSNTPAILKAAKTFHWRRKHLTSVINILAQALYSLFAANDAQLRALQRGCFAYFQRGGQCVDGPVGLLAGIIRQPLVLVYHFFSVAVLAMWLFVMEPEVVSVDAPNGVDTVQGEDGNEKEVVLDEKGMGKKVKGKRRDWVGVPGRVVRSGGVLWKACVVIVPYIWSEMRA